MNNNTNALGRPRGYSTDAKPVISIPSVLQALGIEHDKGKFLCPAHDDHNPSADFNGKSSGDDQRLWGCFSCGAGGDAYELVQKAKGCDFKDAAEWIESQGLAGAVAKVAKPASKNLKVHTTFNAAAGAALFSTRQNKGKDWQATKTTEYKNADESTCFYVVRFESPDGSDKTFKQISPHDGGYVCSGIEGLRPLLDVCSLNSSLPLVVVEGEKACDAARSMGLQATTWAGGAQSVHKTDWSVLKGFDVTIWPDRDKGGEDSANYIVKAIRETAAELRVLPVDFNKNDGFDAADAVAELGHEGAIQLFEDLKRKATKQAIKKVTGDDFSFGEVTEMINSDSTASYRSLVEGYIEASQSMLVGMIGTGKGCFGPLLANHITNGLDWWNGRPCRPGSVVIISTEDNPETIKQRCRFAGARVHGDMVDGQPINAGPRVLCMGSGTAALKWPDGRSRSIDETSFFDTLAQGLGDLRLIVVDPVKQFMGKRGPSESEEDHVRRVLSISLTWANRNGVAILLITHPAKGAGVRHVNDQAAGSHAWTAVTRSVVSLEKNPNYGKVARALIPGRQSNSAESPIAIFDLEVGEARDAQGQKVPKLDQAGDPIIGKDGVPEIHAAVRLSFRELLSPDENYELPPFDREGLSKSRGKAPSGRQVIDWDEVRQVAAELVASAPGGRMRSYPDDDFLAQLGTVDEDDRWLTFACGTLARRFKCTPLTVLRNLRQLFRKKDKVPIPGYFTSVIREGGIADSGQWFWTSSREQAAATDDDDEPAF